MDSEEQPLQVRIDTPDKWRTFTLLVQAQSKDPLDFLREAIHNSLDAQARSIRVYIERDGKRRPLAVTISDNGAGAPAFMDPTTQQHRVLLKPDKAHPDWGEFARPELEYIPGHAADSLKAKSPRRETVGEFGIGLYTFWALGASLTLTTRVLRPNHKPTDTWVLEMSREQELTSVRRTVNDPAKPICGTSVRVEDLRPEALQLLRRDKVVSRLSDDLRQRLLQLGDDVRVEVGATGEEDRRVEPRRYAGEPWDPSRKPKKVMTPYGTILFDIYLLPETDRTSAVVSATSNGAFGYHNITALDRLNIYPWNSNKVQGNIEFSGAKPNPSHDGFLPGKELSTFIEKVLQATQDLTKMLKVVEQRRLAELDKKSRDRILKVFNETLRELDPDAYSPFRSRGTRLSGGAPVGEAQAQEGTPLGPAQPETVLSLDHVVVKPSEVFIQPTKTADLRALAYDSQGRIVHSGLTFKWSVVSGTHLVVFASDPSSPSVSLVSRGILGSGKVEVCVTQDSVTKCTLAEIHVVEKMPLNRQKPRAAPGVPNPEFRPLWPMEKWRSNYDEVLGNIVINTGHPDYARAATSSSPRDKEVYILTCMAKELLLFNHGTENVGNVLERVVEVIPLVIRHM